MSRKRIAITGADGFIGRSLLPKIEDYYDLHIFQDDLLTGKGIRKFLDGSEILIHLAGQVLPGTTSMDEGNVKTTENLISSALKSSIKKIIFASSIAVYGDSNGKIFTENDICKPNTEYGKSKLAAEGIINGWSRKTGGESLILRFFSIYGPKNKKGVIYNLCSDFIKNGEVNVFGDGLQKRDLVYIDDVTDLLKLSINHNLNGIYNVGSGEYYSILDLVSIIEAISRKKIKINFQKSEINKVGEVVYSINKLKVDFKWKPKVDIREGVERVYKYLLANEK